MNKHTPGPWVVKIEEDDNGFPVKYITGAGKNYVAELTACHQGKEQLRDDARLIAAAPELLASLKLLVSYADSRSIWDGARAAITKAEGGTQ